MADSRWPILGGRFPSGDSVGGQILNMLDKETMENQS